MANDNFRDFTPHYSSLNVKYSNYRKYKKFLEKDFRNHCGYCNDWDFFCGGSQNFHIDHFAPKSLFPEKENDYHNLIYSCPYCNKYKSNKWLGSTSTQNIVDNKGFVHPCDTDYEKHFRRNSNYEIIANDEIGKYIFDELHLYLKRHSIIYSLEKIYCKIIELQNNNSLSNEVQEELNKAHKDFFEYYMHLNTGT